MQAQLFISGTVTMGFLVSGLFFLRFWQRTRDRLFIAFGVAFWLFAANQALVALSGVPSEHQSWFYALRIAGFALLIAAIVAKSVKRRPAA
ncbi:MAG TPA: DUF5985 family protein [Alphaproteobacteria bacterium]|nr:DUF5985 family protein [Alphaproteobacteria bacterium]